MNLKHQATRRHCAVKLLTATVLQLCISCCQLIYVMLLAATPLTFILFRSFTPSFSPFSSTPLQLLGFSKKLQTLCYYDILQRLTSKKNYKTDIPAIQEDGDVNYNLSEWRTVFKIFSHCYCVLKKKKLITGNIRLMQPQSVAEGSLGYICKNDLMSTWFWIITKSF